MIEQFLNLPTPVITAILLTGLVIAFIVAFKAMEMIFETVTIAILSGIFYTSLTVFIGGPEFGFNDLLLFSLLGASLYMLYSFLATAIKTTETLIKIPLTLFLSGYRPIKRAFNKGVRKIKHEIRSRRETEVSEKTTKEVVLDKTD